MVVSVGIVLIVEKRPMEEGRPLRSEEGRQKGPATSQGKEGEKLRRWEGV
jgi:hypothetical protein